jgi:hypothetical protein
VSLDVDADIVAGIVNAWAATDPAAAALRDALPLERLHSDYTPAKKGQALQMPYADVVVTQARPPLQQAPVKSGSKYLHYAKVLLVVRDVGKAKTGQALGKLRGAFPESRQLSIPDSTWLRTLRLPEGDRVEREKDRRFGEDVHKGTLALELWVERTEP